MTLIDPPVTETPATAAAPYQADDVSATVPDWSRERCRFLKWEPGQRLLRSVRSYQKWQKRGGLLGRVMCKLAAARNKFWGVMCGSDLPVTATIGGGLWMPHPQGIILHGLCSIGPNCLIFHQVTVGSGGTKPGVPKLGGHVDIGCGAKVLGGIVVGDHARIGANAVVLCDVPAGATAVGIPAKIIPARKPT